jgi:hypothetical protein
MLQRSNVSAIAVYRGIHERHVDAKPADQHVPGRSLRLRRKEDHARRVRALRIFDPVTAVPATAVKRNHEWQRFAGAIRRRNMQNRAALARRDDRRADGHRLAWLPCAYLQPRRIVVRRLRGAFARRTRECDARAKCRAQKAAPSNGMVDRLHDMLLMNHGSYRHARRSRLARGRIARRPGSAAHGDDAPGPRSARPGFAPVCVPSRMTRVPLTKTYFTPRDN